MAKKKILVLPRNRKERQRYFVALGLLLGLLVLAVVAANRDEQVLPANDPQAKVHSALIKKWAPEARQMQAKYGVLASISLAQGILESDWEQSVLAKQYHNLYGVKAYGNQPSILIRTKEFQNGQWIEINDYFVVYQNWQASMADHARLLREGTSWNAAQYQHVMAAKNYQAAAKALVKDGYATDPQYAAKIINIIETWHLQRFDLPK